MRSRAFPTLREGMLPIQYSAFTFVVNFNLRNHYCAIVWTYFFSFLLVLTNWNLNKCIFFIKLGGCLTLWDPRFKSFNQPFYQNMGSIYTRSTMNPHFKSFLAHVIWTHFNLCIKCHSRTLIGSNFVICLNFTFYSLPLLVIQLQLRFNCFSTY